MNKDTNEDRIAQRLIELRAAMVGLDSPARIKPAVLEAFRARQRRRRGHYVFSAIAVCAALLAFGLYWSRTQVEPSPQSTVPIAKAPVSPLRESHLSSQPERPAPPRRRRIPAPRPAHQVSAEVATAFLALPFAPPVAPDDAIQVVRVTLPRSAMRSVGLPVDEERLNERVPADVVLGQDGIARAVRFMKFAQ